MGPLCELEEMHGVDLGQGYKNDHAPLGDKVFVGFLGCEVCICTAFILHVRLSDQTYVRATSKMLWGALLN